MIDTSQPTDEAAKLSSSISAKKAT